MKGLGETFVVDSLMFNLVGKEGDFRLTLKFNDTCEGIKQYLSLGNGFVIFTTKYI